LAGLGAARLWSKIAVDAFDVLPDGKHVVAIPAYPDLEEGNPRNLLVFHQLTGCWSGWWRRRLL
jgi:hypothetical protein